MAYARTMPGDSDNHPIAVEPLDWDRLYANDLKTCAMSGVGSTVYCRECCPIPF